METETMTITTAHDADRIISGMAAILIDAGFPPADVSLRGMTGALLRLVEHRELQMRNRASAEEDEQQAQQQLREALSACAQARAIVEPFFGGSHLVGDQKTLPELVQAMHEAWQGAQKHIERQRAQLDGVRVALLEYATGDASGMSPAGLAKLAIEQGLELRKRLSDAEGKLRACELVGATLERQNGQLEALEQFVRDTLGAERFPAEGGLERAVHRLGHWYLVELERANEQTEELHAEVERSAREGAQAAAALADARDHHQKYCAKMRAHVEVLKGQRDVLRGLVAQAMGQGARHAAE